MKGVKFKWRNLEMIRTFFIIGVIFAGLAVALGAFGAHGLSSRLSPERLETFETGARYQMYHALALLAVAWALANWPQVEKLLSAGGWLFVVGNVLFSGSLFLLSVTGFRWLGAITPLGGVAYVVGWLCLLLAGMRV
jgi:uncharacterized membrane protein YgdD (TMEM256/DUF423 family)